MGNQIQIFVWRMPKNNHDAMVKLGKEAVNLFRNFGVRQELFQLKDIKTYENMGFTNIAKTVSANGMVSDI